MAKILLKSLILAFALIGCNSKNESKPNKDMLNLFKKKDPIDKFWKWFQENEKSLSHFGENNSEPLSQVLDSLKTIQKGLAVEFEPAKNNIITVTISADGDRNLFPVVQHIVSKAPKIEGWAFVAFRQRMPTDKVKDLVLQSGDIELNSQKMKFFPIVDNDSLDIIIYVKNVTEKNYNQVAYGGLTLLDNILGEYDCVTKVRRYDFQNMPIKQEDLKDLKPLADLANYVDSFHKAKNN